MSLESLKKIVFVIALLPLTLLVYALFTNQLGVNPVEAITRDTGLWALRFLFLTLAITPLRRLTGVTALVRFRRMLGLYAFFYAVVHMLLYLWLDQFFDIDEIVRDIIKRPFITIGFASFIAFIPLVVTSTNAMMRKLGGQRWKKLHRLTYAIAIASSVHFFMLVKQDKSEPLVYIALLSVLLLARVIHSLPKSAVARHKA